MFKASIQTVLDKFGFRLVRIGQLNRFDAMVDVLVSLNKMGYRPPVIIDAGANIGKWATLARRLNQGAIIHLIEPLPNCTAFLQVLAKADGKMCVHPFAATMPGVSRVRMNLVGVDGMATSAQVALAEEVLPDEALVPASTIDERLYSCLEQGALLKLDLQGHEIPALRGATCSLEKIEVIISEANFYQVNNNGRPIFSNLHHFLNERGFELFDIASLMGRSGDNRLQWGDVVFVRKDSKLSANRAWRL